MFKKIFDFQRLLLSTASWPKNYSPFTGAKVVAAFFFINVFLNISLNIGDASFIVFLLVCAFLTHKIILKSRDIYSLMPVSNRFLIGNMFLIPIVTTCLALLILLVIATVIFCLIMLIVFLFGITSVNPHISIFETNENPELRANLLLFFSTLIFINVSIAFSFIRRKVLRMASFITSSVIVFSFLFIINIFIKNMVIVEIADDGTKFSHPLYERFIQGFSYLTHADTIFICTGIAAIVIIPLSIFVGYKIYIYKK